MTSTERKYQMQDGTTFNIVFSYRFVVIPIDDPPDFSDIVDIKSALCEIYKQLTSAFHQRWFLIKNVISQKEGTLESNHEREGER